MKLITQEQQTKIELLFQIITSAVLATVLVSVAVLMTSPYSFSLMQQIVGA